MVDLEIDTIGYFGVVDLMPTIPGPPPTAGALYDLCATPKPPGGGWFSPDDTRFFWSVLCFYRLCLMHPIRFTYFNLIWNRTYLSRWKAPLATLCFPLMPIGLYLFTLIPLCIKKVLGIQPKKDPHSPFFDPPPDVFSSTNATCYFKMIVRVGSFLQFGTDPCALQHTVRDVICTKEFWFKLLDSVGARRPHQLGVWNGTEVLDVDAGVGAGTSDLVCKIADSYLGIGDIVFKRGVDFESTPEPLTQALRKNPLYQGKHALLCELIQPVKPSTVRLSSAGFSNTHSLDIITVRDRMGKVSVLSCLLWTDCRSWTSHTSTAGFVVDVVTETIIGTVPWYSFAFVRDAAQGGQSALIGTKVPGLHACLHLAIAAHEASDIPWLKSVGWDVMITDEGPVFFEGNVGSMRTPRRIFMTPGAFAIWLRDFGVG